MYLYVWYLCICMHLCRYVLFCFVYTEYKFLVWKTNGSGCYRRRAILFTWFSEPHDTTSLYVACPSVYGTWQSQAVTHPIMNRARRCLTSVIEPTPMSERRIPYIYVCQFAMIIYIFYYKFSVALLARVSHPCNLVK